MAIAAADPAPAAVITWARGSTTLPGGPDPGGARPAGGIDDGEAGFVDLAAQAGQQAIGVGHVARPDEHRGPRDHPAVGQLDAGQPVVLDHQPRDLAARRSARRVPPAARARPRSGRSVWAKKTTSSDHCRTSSACPTDAGQGAQHAERLVADLPAVAVRAVQEVPAPPLADAGDVGQLVADTGRDQDPPRASAPGRRRGGPRTRRSIPATRSSISSTP